MRVEVSVHSTQERERIQEIRASQSVEQRVAQIDLDRIRRNLRNSTSTDTESMVYDPEEQPWFNKERSAFSYNPFIHYIEHGDIGTMSEGCAHFHMFSSVRTFSTHINVESCTSVQSIKYMYKYVKKGSDQATFALQSTDGDEVTKYQYGRYISTSEAVWRILAFSIHDRYPTVMHLDIHLENGQRIYFDPDNVAARLENPRQTTLLAFIRLREGNNFARSLTYDEVPSYYTYDKQRGVFNRRRRGHAVDGFPGCFKDTALGRVYTVHTNNGVSYYLRMLLNTVRGPTSFAFLRTVDDIEFPTYRAACVARHLLDGDQHWDNALKEASISDSPSRLRHLFAVMLVFCGIANLLLLWEKYRHLLSEDFLRALRRTTEDNTEATDERVQLP